MSSFGSQRVTTDASSGRIERWIGDLVYALSAYSPFDFLFGRGIDYVFNVNLQIFGISINSLSLLIDLFLDYGVIGMILLIFAYVQLFEIMWNPKTSGFFWGVIAFFCVTAMINSLVSYITIMTMLLLILYVFKFDGDF